MKQPSHQRYVSHELTHFTGRSLKEQFPITEECEEHQYELLRAILTESKLKALVPHVNEAGDSFRMITWPGVPISSNEMFSPAVVCFCDIPIADLPIHIGKYTPFGLSFSKEFLLTRGASPVFYVSSSSKANFPPPRLHGSPTNMSQTMDELFLEYNIIRQEVEELVGEDASDNRTYPLDIYDFMRRLYQLIHDLDVNIFSYIKCFDAMAAEDHEENFYMEREWRVLGAVIFTLDDLHRVIFPARFAQRFREDFPKYMGQITFADA